MYIELFLADNFVFNMLILRIASAITHLRYSRVFACVISALLSVYAAFAVNVSPLRSLPAKIALLLVISVPFFIKLRKISLPVLFGILLATVICGGAVYVLSNGFLQNTPAYVRLFLYPALALTFLPALIRFIKKKSTKSANTATVRIRHKGVCVETRGIYDSGCLLCEPVSGIPVILVYAPGLLPFAHLPVSYSDTSGLHGIKIFIPESVEIDGCEVCAFLAPLTERENMPAVIPFTYKSICQSTKSGRNAA